MRDYVLLSPSSGSLVNGNRGKPRGSRGEQGGGYQAEAAVFDSVADLLKHSIVANCMAGLGVTLFEAQRRGNKGFEKLIQVGQLGPDNFKG